MEKCWQTYMQLKTNKIKNTNEIHKLFIVLVKIKKQIN